MSAAWLYSTLTCFAMCDGIHDLLKSTELRPYAVVAGRSQEPFYRFSVLQPSHAHAETLRRSPSLTYHPRPPRIKSENVRNVKLCSVVNLSCTVRWYERAIRRTLLLESFAAIASLIAMRRLIKKVCEIWLGDWNNFSPLPIQI